MPGAQPEERYSSRVTTKQMPRLDVPLLPGRVVGEQLADDADGRSTRIIRLMCDFMLISQSKKTPRLRTTADGDMVSGPILINFSTEESLLRFVAEPNHITSVLFVFS